MAHAVYQGQYCESNLDHVILFIGNLSIKTNFGVNDSSNLTPELQPDNILIFDLNKRILDKVECANTHKATS